MDYKFKILLGSEDILLKDNEDLFVNINLNRSFFEYKKEKYDNDFDLAKQFEKERNESRSFRIYGIVQSNVINCDAYPISVYSDPSLTNLIYSTTTSKLNFNGNINVYNKRRGKYYIVLDNYTGDTVYILIKNNNVNVSDQVFEQRFVFYDLDGEFISYGTETIEVDNDLNTIEVNNNFPFFYNKHWIKKDLDIIEEKQAEIQFSSSLQEVLEGDEVEIKIGLNKPSPFGKEKVDFIFNSLNSTAGLSEFVVYCGTTSNTLLGNTQLLFSKGEQEKTLIFKALDDVEIEMFEQFAFTLDNFIFVKPGLVTDTIVKIEDQTPRHYSNYIISGMYENRTPFVGKSASTAFPTVTYSTPSIFRNGLYYLGDQQEFYPSDIFELEIENVGGKTILPANSGLGNTNDQMWEAGEIKTFTIQPQYSSSIVNKVSLYLPPSLNNSIGASVITSSSMQNSIAQVIKNISINGFVLNYFIGTHDTSGTISSSTSVCFDALKKFLSDGQFDLYNFYQLQRPFTIVSDPSSYTITLIANSPGTRLDVKTNVGNITPDKVATATTIVNFSYPKQQPLEFNLLGNQSSNSEAAYHFSFKKNGYKTLNVFNTVQAGITPVDNYLVTAYREVLHSWDTPNDRPIPFSGDPMQVGFLSEQYFLPKTDVYYEGVALLNNGTPYSSTNQNLTNYGPTNPGGWGVDYAIWQNSPLSRFPQTYTEVSTQTVAQKGLLVIYTPIVGVHNSFDFRSGGAGNFTTFYWQGYEPLTNLYNNPSALRVSGNTIPPRTTDGLKYEIDLGGNFTASQLYPPASITVNISVGPILTTTPSLAPTMLSTGFISPYYPTNSANDNITYMGSHPSIVMLEAKTSGVPFEIKNIIAPLGNTIMYFPIVENEKDSVTINPYNNKMGGFTVIQP